MKKVLEYKVFDLLKNKDNSEFLDKVKKENPDMYSKFLNIVGNKGLEIAKQKYQEFDPEYIKQKKKEEKHKLSLLKKKSKKENIKNVVDNILKSNEVKVKEIENIISNSVLIKVYNYLMKDERISNYFKSYNVKKQYVNNFKLLIDKPTNMGIYRLKNIFEYNSIIDTLLMTYEEPDIYEWEDNGVKEKNIIKINQYYDSNKKEFTYSIYFKMPDFIFKKIDIGKNENFLRLRSEFIEKMNTNNITISEVYNIIDKFSAALDERVYQNWYEKWKQNQTIGKYNL